MIPTDLAKSYHLSAEAHAASVSTTSGQRTGWVFTFETFFEPFVGDLISKVNGSSLSEMLDPGFLGALKRDYSEMYTVLAASALNLEIVKVVLPPADFDVSAGGPNTIYHQELSLFAPIAQAVQLSQKGYYAEAEKFFPLVFDPTFSDAKYPFWKYLGFRQDNLTTSLIDALSYTGDDPVKQRGRTQALNEYRAAQANPFDANAAARNRPVALMLYVCMKWLDNLIAHGDNLRLRNTPETNAQAALQYWRAANLLGKRPTQLPPRGTPKPMSYAELKARTMDVMGNALVDLEVQFPFNSLPGGSPPPLASGSHASKSAAPVPASQGLMQALYFCIPPNAKLLGYWDVVADRLYKVWNCEDQNGAAQQLALFDPKIDPSVLIKAANAGIDVFSALSGLSQFVGPLRALPRIRLAIGHAETLRSFGAALEAAFEKGDNEQLVALRQQNELQIHGAMQEVRYLQWKQAQEATRALIRSHNVTYERYAYYMRLLDLPVEQDPLDDSVALDDAPPPALGEETFDGFYQQLVMLYNKALAIQPYPPLDLAVAGVPQIAAGAADAGQLYLSRSEDEELNSDLPKARDLRAAGSAINTIAGLMTAIPDLTANVEYLGLGASSLLFGGTKIAEGMKFAAEVIQIAAGVLQDNANLSARRAGYQRRAHEYHLSVNQAARELMEIGRRLIGSRIAERAAYQDYLATKQQATQAQNVLDFLASKTTNAALHANMSGTLIELYYQFYRFSADFAQKTEIVAKRELMREQFDVTQHVQFNYFDSGRRGLLAGEALLLDLKRMEAAYHDADALEFEITRQVSLRQLSPDALVDLRTIGSCSFSIPEWYWNLFCPGHYALRIRSVALSLPCVVGPNTPVNCAVALHGSSVRISSLLKNGRYGRQGDADDRFVDYAGAVEEMVTSTASNDNGMFEFNLHDDKRLHFEFQGLAESKWTLALPQEFRPFDYTTISEARLTLRYTARNGGQALADQATAELKTIFAAAQTSDLALLLMLPSDFRNEWVAFARSSAAKPTFTFRLTRDHFPYFIHGRKLTINSMVLLGEDTAGKAVVPEAADKQPTAPDSAGLNAADKGYIDISIDKGDVLRADARQVYLVVRYSVGGMN